MEPKHHVYYAFLKTPSTDYGYIFIEIQNLYIFKQLFKKNFPINKVTAVFKMIRL